MGPCTVPMKMPNPSGRNLADGKIGIDKVAIGAGVLSRMIMKAERFSTGESNISQTLASCRANAFLPKSIIVSSSAPFVPGLASDHPLRTIFFGILKNCSSMSISFAFEVVSTLLPMLPISSCYTLSVSRFIAAALRSGAGYHCSIVFPEDPRARGCSGRCTRP